MFNVHKLITYYSTIVMLGIGGTFLRSPNRLLDSLFGVLPRVDGLTVILEGMDPAYQFAYQMAFASHLLVGLVGLYAIWHNTTIHRRFGLLVFGIHQALFLWASGKMPSKWQQAGFVLPMQTHVVLAILLWVIWEPEPEAPSLKRRRRQRVKKD